MRSAGERSRGRWRACLALASLGAIAIVALLAHTSAARQSTVLTGAAAFGDWQTDSPGVRRKITPADLPPPFATAFAANDPEIVDRPEGAMPKVPPGFVVDDFASGLDRPRLIRSAPNGDLFVAESMAGQIRILRAADGATKAERLQVFATHLHLPFGIAFWPPGPEPQYVYVANTDSVVRFPYSNGDLQARGPAQTVVNNIPGGSFLRGGGHWTRDVVFSPDGAKMFISVGSSTNDAEKPAWYWFGASKGNEEKRADVLQCNADGSGLHIFASGLRNCVGMAIDPATGELWCSSNERDGLGDNLPPDYITRVKEGGFFGWPWYYIGGNEDPNHHGERPDLKSTVIVPDVLIQAHSASLEMTFYQGSQFPAEYRGNAFAAEHGSWNRSRRTGYKVIRVIVHDGIPTGEYEDFMTGLVTPDGGVWARPVGVTVAHDGALIVTEDAHGTVWRIAYRGPATPP